VVARLIVLEEYAYFKPTIPVILSFFAKNLTIGGQILHFVQDDKVV